MPELPEVETVVRDLRPRPVGSTIRAVAVSPQSLRREWLPVWTPLVVGRTIAGVSRRGKWIRVPLDGGSTLLWHLGMTGQLTVVQDSRAVADHTHVRMTLGDPEGEELRFRDVRRFGSVELWESPAELDAFLDARLGPEPFDLSAEGFFESLRASARPLKALLLDQKVVAGVGNIYADEALFAARLPPSRKGRDITRAEADALREAVVAVLSAAVAGRGSTIRDYVGGSGLEGTYQDAHAAYGRDGQPCPRCGATIALTRLAGRSTHYCPTCQAAPPAPAPEV